jgi:hypothetical protein
VNLHRDYDFSTEFSKEFSADLTKDESPGDQLKVAAPRTSFLAMAMLPASRRQLLSGGQEGEDGDNVVGNDIVAANDETTQLRMSVKDLQDQVQQLQDRLRRQDQQEEFGPYFAVDDDHTTVVAKN